MLDDRLLVHFSSTWVVLAHNHSKLAAGIAEDRGSIHALNVLNYERATGTGAVGKSLVLSKAVCVPRHIEFSEPGRRRTNHLSCFSHKWNSEFGIQKRAVQGLEPGKLTFKLRNAYYFGVHGK